MNLKKVSLIGGTSWHSTIDYYRYICENVENLTGGKNSGEIYLHSLDWRKIAKSSWIYFEDIVNKAFNECLSNSPDGLALCSNTIHCFADDIERQIERSSNKQVKLIDIRDAIATEILSQKDNELVGNSTRALLLGTKTTMSEAFYIEHLLSNGVSVNTPEQAEQVKINDIIYNELCKGTVDNCSRSYLKNLIEKYALDGWRIVILGCTELGMILPGEYTSTSVGEVMLLDTCKVHAMAIAKFMVGEN